MKRKWILQFATIIAAFALFIFTVNTCAAQMEEYKIVGMGCTINETNTLLPITTEAVFTINDETDVIGVKVNESISYMYLLTDPIGTEDNLKFKGATFLAVDPENHKYFINMRMYRSGEIQITIGDKDARAAVVFFLQTVEGVDGITAAK